MSFSELAALRVVVARPEQAGAIAGVITEVAVWREAEFGPRLNDWEIPFPEAYVRESMAIGRVLVGELSDQVIATLTLTESEPAIWHDKPANALHITKFAVVPDMHHKGVGRKMLEKAAGIAIAEGKTHLRGECNNLNPGLRNHYVRLGGETCGRKEVGCCYTAARYEYEL